MRLGRFSQRFSYEYVKSRRVGGRSYSQTSLTLEYAVDLRVLNI